MTESGEQFGRYRVLRRIGSGGMAEVFLAEAIGVAGFSRTVAIKIIAAQGTPHEAVSLFLDEARVASFLQHPSIVQTLDLGVENDTLFIAMEYVSGPPLSRILQELKANGQRMSPRLTAYVGAKIAQALDYAHRRVVTPDGQPLRLVHRDVSPQNILISRDGHVKLTDFGVARASIQMHKTKTGQVRGKAAYMAPEQVRAQPLDGRTDMFALSLVLYEALTGVRPYHRKSEVASMRAVIDEDVPPIHDANPDVPDALVQVILRGLRRDPDERFSHCGAFEEALMGTLVGERIHALEPELSRLIVDLFGEEETNDLKPNLEAWHPTLAKSDATNTPKWGDGRGRLTPEIRRLLDAKTPAGEAALRNPERTQTLEEVAAEARDLDEHGDAVVRSTRASMHSTPMASPLSSPIAVPTRPRFLRFLSTKRLRVVARLLPVSAAVGLLAGLGLFLSQRDPKSDSIETMALPLSASEPQPIPVAPRPQESTLPQVEHRPSNPGTRSATTTQVAIPASRVTAPRSTARRAPVAESPNDATPPSRVTTVAEDRGQLISHVLALKARARGQRSLEHDLGRIANDLLIGKELTERDREILARASAMLPSD